MRRFRHPVLISIGALVAINTIAFGMAQSASTSGTATGTVYRDANNNGVRDTGEAGLANVVVMSATATTVTNQSGGWSLPVTGKQQLTVLTGWYRTQCNTLTCSTGPGPDQDFKVSYQNIVATANGPKNPRLDVGLVPDWPGGYPIPSTRPLPSNDTDVSARVSFVKPTGVAGESNCYRTDIIANRACAIGDRPVFLLQMYNEGTTPIANPAGHVQLPPGTRFVSLNAAGGNHPALGIASYGMMDRTTRRIPISITGTLPAGAVARYELILEVIAGAPITAELQTGGSYPNPVGLRVTSVIGDAEGDLCPSNSLDCPWGTTDRQVTPDNSDTTGFAIVPALEEAEPLPTPTTAAPTTTAPAPTTTVPPTTTTAPAPTTTVRPTTTTAPAPTTTAPAAPPLCTVSGLLVPSCGAWLGSSVPPKDDSGDLVKGLAEYEAVARNTPDILHFYKTNAARFPNSTEISLAERTGKQRSLLLYNWKPSSTLTWAQIANGGADDAIDTVAASIKAYPHKLFLNIYHEPEDNIDPTAGSGMTAQDYARMYRYVVTKLRQAGVNNAVFVWNTMGYYGWRDYLDALYPGHDYVDWMCYDPYGRDASDVTDMSDLVQRDRPNIDWPGYYAWATAKAPGKPIMLCEWGVDINTHGDPASVLAGGAAQMQAEFPMLKAFVYWNGHGPFYTRIDDTSAKGVAYGAAFRELAAHPYFNAMTPDSAP